ncbi:hypothetical protein BCR33DRAFT_567276 [Rhizoclosmatium globosum]|uniref:Uncharacterized protein n=1 Tax=Rhizoclosmatium globosum TaxID=329046 RepID=A0A1Y2B6Q0_9FUNG|nr:hypothetical protein BCR33DRAFT_567276 [Rhizoclosmatium globosum]|eukprot:ORY30511.1 hypothetical protein BCR33DRAFT_567276 [Rhizoclosmatium globosum]
MNLLPLEIIEDILLQLPIDGNLRDIGFTSKKLFAGLIFQNISFARRHYRHQCNATGKKTHCQFLDIKHGNFKAVLRFLPASYQIGLAVEGLFAEEHIYCWRPCSLKDKELSAANTLLLVRYLAMQGIDPSFQNDAVFRWASTVGSLEAVELLLEHSSVDPAARDNEAIVNAASGGHLNIVKRLLSLPNVDANAKEDRSLYCAALNGHSEVVKILLPLPRTDPRKVLSEALFRASHEGHKDTTKLLLAVECVDPSKAMFYTALRNDPDGLDILLKDGRGHPTGPDIHRVFHKLVRRQYFHIVEMLWNDPRVVVREQDYRRFLAITKKYHLFRMRRLLEELWEQSS